MTTNRPEVAHDKVETLPFKIPSKADKLKNKVNEVIDEELETTEDAFDIDELPVVDVEEWLGGEVDVPEKYIPLKTRKAKIKIKAMTEAERKELRKAAPKRLNKKTGERVPDMEWINLELVRRCIVEPTIPSRDMLDKTLAGELAYIATEISELSGFGTDTLQRDALE